MPLNGSGGASQPVGSIYPAVASTLIEAGKFNVSIADIYSILSSAVYKDGQSTTTAQIPFAQGVGTDTIAELTSAAGVTIDSLKIKDGGIADTNGNEAIKVGTTASAVNEITVTNAATGNGPSIAATGGDTNIPVTLSGKGTGKVVLGQATSTEVQLIADQPLTDASGNELVKFSKTASAVNEITVANAATGGAPIISATGGDTNIPLRLTPKGTGDVQFTDGTDATKIVALEVSGLTTATTRTLTMGDADFTLGAATQADQETGTSTTNIVTPGRQHFHPSAAKAWGKFAGATGTLAESYNVTSVVRDSAGDYTVTLATDFATADYVIALTPSSGSVAILRVASQAAGTFTIKSVAFDFTDNDPTAIFFVCFGDFA